MKNIINEMISENVEKCQKPQNNVLKRIIVSMSLYVECGWGVEMNVLIGNPNLIRVPHYLGPEG